jgi:hypothetical protein
MARAGEFNLRVQVTATSSYSPTPINWHVDGLNTQLSNYRISRVLGAFRTLLPVSSGIDEPLRECIPVWTAGCSEATVRLLVSFGMDICNCREE